LGGELAADKSFPILRDTKRDVLTAAGIDAPVVNLLIAAESCHFFARKDQVLLYIHIAVRAKAHAFFGMDGISQG